MGRNLQQANSTIIGKSRPSTGCMWGVLHILKYQQWRHIKKRLPYRSGASNKQAVGAGNPGHDTNDLKTGTISEHERLGNNSSMVDEKITQPAPPVAKSSVKSRLKALLSDELYRRKGKHRRSESCPVRSPLTRTDPIRHLEPSDKDPIAARNSNAASPTIADDNKLSDPLVSNSFEGGNSDGTGNHLGHKQVDETGKKLIENRHFLENSDSESENLVPSKELNIDASTYKSKEVSDAIVMINMNKEFLLKILKDPGSPLAHRFRNQQTLSHKRAFSKSLSFSSPGNIRDSGSRKIKQKQGGVKSDAEKPSTKEYFRSHSMPSIAAEYRMDGIQKLNLAMAETADPSSCSVHRRKNKSFRDIKHKIKHAIKHSKNEKQRITMDAVLHKIPHGHGFPNKDLKSHTMSRDGKESHISSNESEHSLPCSSKSELRRFRRTASLNESIDKYCQLYESTNLNREPKQLSSDTSKSRTIDASSPQTNAPKSMRRMSSSPNLKSYFCYSEDSSQPVSSSQIKNAVDESTRTKDDFSEQFDAESRVESNIQQTMDSETNSINGDQLGKTTVSDIGPEAELGLVGDDLGNLLTMEDASEEEDMETQSKSSIELAEANSVHVPDSKCEEETTIPASFPISEDLEVMTSPPLPSIIDSLEDQLVETISKDTPTTEKIDILSKHLTILVGAKEKAEFDYVRDILEISGFSGTELLGTWHSNNQPMDPCLFEEMEEDCMVLDPECPGNVEGYRCDHLLLFDLINEVLMEIYAKSYTYYPRPLSALSHIRPMPVGQHVLEEVWANISWYLSSIPEADQLLDHIVSGDLAKSDGWMNLQFDSECAGLEVEDLIFDDLLEEIIFT
ncbi:hypothetical protein P3X46_008934 [Hevea brasiliensis]|uniref:DUF4378 domain-containing protein n=1 Tax=Hevea brasiliensis TaxID=3981 RepID=A0ABQ9MK75_HEVBR|nr:uncharacterized protein LOC110637586 [Hevea brasiliensis]KAJ9180722.1 hypothetical protein P3X46_008934 [Hevea brasiliensis]